MAKLVRPEAAGKAEQRLLSKSTATQAGTRHMRSLGLARATKSWSAVEHAGTTRYLLRHLVTNASHYTDGCVFAFGGGGPHQPFQAE